MIIKTTNKPVDVDREAKEVISNHANKSETAAWNRKRKAIERLIDSKITPLEEKMLELNTELMPLYDELTKLRKEMVDYCIHPADMLIGKEGIIECKFCMSRMAVPKVKADGPSEG